MPNDKPFWTDSRKVLAFAAAFVAFSITAAALLGGCPQ